MPPQTSKNQLPFPAYLSSPLKFRRKSSTSSAASSNLAASPASTLDLPPATSPPVPSFLTGSTSRLRCAGCLADLALTSQIISKGFTGRHGRAYLVAPGSPLTDPVPSPSGHQPAYRRGSGVEEAARRGRLPNTFECDAVPRQLVTGMHTVGDICCSSCGKVIGWKYVAAEEEAQRYKVGKFILEGKRVVSWGGWEDEDDMESALTELSLDGRVAKKSNQNARFEEDEIQFDSHDEDECEELFMGVWNPQTAARRRRMKHFGKND